MRINFQKRIFILMALTSIIFKASAQTWQSNMVKFGTNGKLTYTADANQNSIPDFSYSGYKNSNEAIPQLTKVIATLTPQSGDNTAYINNAIAAAASVTPDANGIRGVIVLAKGIYKINGTIKLNVSGVTLRGAGSGSDANANTIIQVLGNTPAQRTALVAGGGSASGWNKLGSYQSNITDNFVKVGSKEFSVASTAGLKVGDNIIIYSPCTTAWINAIGGGGTAGAANWTVNSQPLSFSRVITAINGSKVTIDAPIFNHLNKSLAQAYIYLADRSNIKTQIGLENFRIDIQNWSNEFADEDHAWEAVGLIQIEDSWVKNVVTLHFGHAGFRMNTASRLTLDNCQALVPVATITPERRYNFNCEDRCTNILMKNCQASKARHAFISNGTSSVSGIVVLRCKATDNYTSSEGHRRWSMGMLFDNFTTAGAKPSDGRELGLYSRGNYGTSHGWSLAHSVAWNCNFKRADGTSGSVTVQQPPTAQNYVIGGYGQVNTSVPFPQYAKGYVEGFNRTDGKQLSPASLFDQQLLDRQGPVNQAPTVSLTSPTNNSSYTTPANIIINATASDVDGAVSKVEFYNGTTLLGTSTSSPYTFTWFNVPSGNYTITAKATDNAGSTTTSSSIIISVVTNQPNQPPTVSLTSPANNESFNAPASITINGTASDIDGTIASVEFYNGSTLLGSDNTSPYSFVWNNVAAGNYSLTAKATDNAGLTTTSTSVNISIVTTQPNLPPTVSISSPVNNSSFNAPASITINSNASDTDGSIAKVDFYNGTTLLGSDNSSPYSFVWNNVAAGSYSLTVKATDNGGLSTTSSPVTIKVNTVTTNPCSGIAQYKENNGYAAGSKVQNSGSQYQCKPYPYSGWCNGAAWAYAPGTGTYWKDAWTLVGSCTSSTRVSSESSSESLIKSLPNPFSGTTNIELVVTESGDVTLKVYNKTGQSVGTIFEGFLNPGTYNYSLDGSNLQNDIYLIKYSNGSSVVTKKIVKTE